MADKNSLFVFPTPSSQVVPSVPFQKGDVVSADQNNSCFWNLSLPVTALINAIASHSSAENEYAWNLSVDTLEGYFDSAMSDWMTSTAKSLVFSSVGDASHPVYVSSDGFHEVTSVEFYTTSGTGDDQYRPAYVGISPNSIDLQYSKDGTSYQSVSARSYSYGLSLHMTSISGTSSSTVYAYLNRPSEKGAVMIAVNKTFISLSEFNAVSNDKILNAYYVSVDSNENTTEVCPLFIQESSDPSSTVRRLFYINYDGSVKQLTGSLSSSDYISAIVLVSSLDIH